MKRSRIAAGVLAASALGATLAGVSAPAARANGGVKTTHGQGTAWFESYGDKLWVNDWAADGHGVHAWVWSSDGTEIVRDLYNSNGFHGSAAFANWNLPENHKYTLEVCLVDGTRDPGFDCKKATIYS
ncbi:hypothetical protein [Flexivirga sp. B27]